MNGWMGGWMDGEPGKEGEGGDRRDDKGIGMTRREGKESEGK